MDALRQHVVALLKGGQAFDSFDDIVSAFATDERGIVPKGAERSAWQIVEHMRLSLRDILDFAQNENGTYVEKDWPADYWPKETGATAGDWDGTIKSFKEDLAELEELVTDENRDLLKPFSWGSGQTLLRQALLAAGHSAYHLGELVELKRWIDAS